VWELLSSWSEDTELWLAVTVLSVGFFVASLIAIPILCVRLPKDYFVRPLQRRAPWKVVLRTIAAVGFIVAGVAMLVLPGQGILTLLLGISLLDFPAKRAWQRRLLLRPTVLRTINGIRRRSGRPPLQTEISDGC
jgi:Putative transmembrane protein (PGPGW)